MRKHQDCQDEEIVMLFLSEHEEAFDEMYHRYWSRLYVNAYKRVKDQDAASEIVQDVFTDLWFNRKERQIRSSLEGYLHTAVRYKTLNYLQKQWIRERYQAEALRTSPVSNNSTEEQVFFGELAARLEQLSSGLPAQCRRVFEMSRKEYKSNSQIADELGISEKTVKNHLTKALHILRMHVGDVATIILLFFTTR